MVRFLLRIGLALLGNALGLIIAAVVLDDMSLDASGFIIAVVIFTVLMVVLQPLIVKVSVQYARALAGSSALVATFVSLLITELISDGLEIEGFGTWVLATIIVWLGSLLAGVLLAALFLREATDNRRGAGSQTFNP
jgi:putative membrane protein